MLQVKRLEGESWRDTVVRYAEPFGLVEAALKEYEEVLSGGGHEAEAAWSALYEWDLIDFT